MKKSLLYLILCLVLFGLPFIAYTSEEYIGANKCKVCHIKIFKSWSDTKHAKAFDILNPGVKAEAKKKAGLDDKKDYTGDPACIQCHTTGNNAMLPGIQCEVCHGAGKNFSNINIMNKSKWASSPEAQRKLAVDAGLVIKPAENNCRACHNEKSPTYKPFDFKSRYDLVKHPKP
ncbi:MAG: cytochrome c family protein [Pseudomonadota bacterium]